MSKKQSLSKIGFVCIEDLFRSTVTVRFLKTAKRYGTIVFKPAGIRQSGSSLEILVPRHDELNQPKIMGMGIYIHSPGERHAHYVVIDSLYFKHPFDSWCASGYCQDVGRVHIDVIVSFS